MSTASRRSVGVWRVASRHLSIAIPALITQFTAAELFAQEREIGHATVEYSPSASQDNGGDTPLEFRFLTVDTAVTVPIAVDRWGITLLPGIAYRLYAAEETTDVGATDPDSFHDLSASLGLARRFNDQWNAVLSVGAGLATDFDELGGDALRMQALALASYNLSPNFTVGGGLILTNSFGQLLILPALQLNYVEERLRVEVLVPQRVAASYALFNGFELGLSAQVSGNQFGVDQDDGVEFLVYSLVDAGATASVRIAGPLWLSFYGGWALSRTLELQDSEQEEIANLDTEEAPVFRATFSFRAPPPATD
ncbi:MAG: DUF6268 family outer membrane beta-barrel protein [Myxococcota bacterium]